MLQRDDVEQSIRSLFSGWDRVEVQHDILRDDLIVTVAVGVRRFLYDVEELRAASVKQAAERVARAKRRRGLWRYGRRQG